MQPEMKQKRRNGRPKIAAGKRKNHNLTVRLSDVDLMLLDDKARRTGLSYSRYMREAGLGRELPRPVPAVNLQTYQELGRIGANLNQLIKHMYEGFFEVNAVAEALRELTMVIHSIRKEVRGQ